MRVYKIPLPRHLWADNHEIPSKITRITPAFASIRKYEGFVRAIGTHVLDPVSDKGDSWVPDRVCGVPSIRSRLWRARSTLLVIGIQMPSAIQPTARLCGCAPGQRR